VALGLSGCDAPIPVIGATTVPLDTTDEIGPYTVSTVLRGGKLDRMEVRTCTDPVCADGTVEALQSFVPVPMEAAGGGAYRADLPGRPAGGQVLFYVRATGAGAVVTDPPTAEVIGATHKLFAFAVVRPGGACRVDADCASQDVCDAGTCRARTPLCHGDGECPGGKVCEGGRCMSPARACTTHADCLVGEFCDRTGKTCGPRPACGTAGLCPGGSKCEIATNVCHPTCSSRSDCDPSESCSDGMCR